MKSRGAATTIRTRWQWSFAGEVVTFALAGAPYGDLGEPLAPRRAFKRLFGWFPPRTSSHSGERQFAEMARRVAQTSHEPTPELDFVDVATAVNERRLFVFTNLCDADGAQSVRVERPLPEIPSMTGDLFGLDPVVAPRASARCEVIALDVAGYGKRAPDARQRLLQAVAMPDTLTADALTTEGSINKGAKRVRDLVSLYRKQRDLGSLRRVLRAYRGNQKDDAEEDDDGPEVKTKWANASSGHALVDVRPRYEAPCTNHRTQSITRGVTTRMIANREAVLRLSFAGRDPDDARSLAVRPTTYRLAARGCHGEAQLVDVEVFPGVQRIRSFEFKASDDGPSLLKGALDKLLRETGVEYKFEFAGSVETFEGWRDCEGDWRVENAVQLAANVSITLHATVVLSALQLAAGVPRSLTDLVGDIRFTADFFCGFGVDGTLSRRERPPAGDAPADRRDEGSLEYSLKGGVELSIEGRIGNDVLGFSATGSATPELRGSGSAGFEDDRCVGTLAVKAAACEFDVEVCTRALVWRHEREWHFPLWKEHDFLRAEHQFYPTVGASEARR